mgnify:CR=1 FL=1
MSIQSWGRGGIRFTVRSLWSAVSKTRRFASRVSEGPVGVPAVGGNVHVYSLYGLGFGSDVTVVVRLDGPSD